MDDLTYILITYSLHHTAVKNKLELQQYLEYQKQEIIQPNLATQCQCYIKQTLCFSRREKNRRQISHNYSSNY